MVNRRIVRNGPAFYANIPKLFVEVLGIEESEGLDVRLDAEKRRLIVVPVKEEMEKSEYLTK